MMSCRSRRMIAICTELIAMKATFAHTGIHWRVRIRVRARVRVGVRIRVRARAGARARARARVRSVSPTSGLPTARILYKIIEVLEARATARRCSMSDMSH